MKKVFFANSQWNQALIFALANASLAFVLFFILGFYEENLPQWLSLTLVPLFVLGVYVFIKELTLFPVKIEQNLSFVFFLSVSEIGKKSSLFILYLAGSFILSVNVIMLYLYIFKL